MTGVTDIPVGSPPVPPGRHAAPGGWYPDPLDRGKERYWDGWQWSRTTRDVEGQPSQPAPYAQPYSGGYPPQTPPGPGPGAPGPYDQDPYRQNPYQQDPYQQDPNQQPYQHYPYQQHANVPGSYPVPQGQNAYGARLSRQQQVTADGVPLAGWWWRVLAVVIDGVILSVIAALLSFQIYGRVFAKMSVVIGDTVRASQNGQPPPPMPKATDLITSTDQLLLTLITLGVGLAYHLIFVRWKAATPGKIICRLRIVPVDRGLDRAPLPWSSVLIRVALWVLPGANSLLLLFRLLDSLFPLWQPKRQALHDRAARTQVVKLG